MTEEHEYWRSLVLDLRDVNGPAMTVASIANETGVDDRQVFRWLEGDKPKGFTAVRLYLLHVKRCPPGRCPPDHSAIAEKG